LLPKLIVSAAGLPDFPWYKIPKREKIYQIRPELKTSQTNLFLLGSGKLRKNLCIYFWFWKTLKSCFKAKNDR
jgi:hypothetical protein